eukprot:scaffold8896_cov95-Isochrysis_galbana.AAC.3
MAVAVWEAAREESSRPPVGWPGPVGGQASRAYQGGLHCEGQASRAYQGGLDCEGQASRAYQGGLHCEGRTLKAELRLGTEGWAFRGRASGVGRPRIGFQKLGSLQTWVLRGWASWASRMNFKG